jgi:hypothetical protein
MNVYILPTYILHENINMALDRQPIILTACTGEQSANNTTVVELPADSTLYDVFDGFYTLALGMGFSTSTWASVMQSLAQEHLISCKGQENTPYRIEWDEVTWLAEE